MTHTYATMEVRYEVTNGMTLCRFPCHRDLHKEMKTRGGVG